MLPTGRRLLPTKKNSYTLVELLLVVIILSIIAGIAIPSFRKTYLNLELDNSANNLALLMRYAQAHSVLERRIYRLNFDLREKRCWLTKQLEGAPNTFEAVSSRLGKSLILPKDIEIESESEFVNFYPDGKIDGISIYLKNKNNKTVTVSTEGQIGYVDVLDFKT